MKLSRKNELPFTIDQQRIFIPGNLAGGVCRFQTQYDIDEQEDKYSQYSFFDHVSRTKETVQERTCTGLYAFCAVP